MARGRRGVSGTVSALLTVLLLVSGFAVSTGLLSAVYVSQAEVMRKAVNMGEAVSERLQAFVYEDVQSNRTLLTVRNVGSTGSEVEYLMAVGYGGEVLREVRPGETLRLGVQQAITLPLADLLGPEFDNYTEVRSVMATLYLKTVKGGVFGSGYMAPPSVMTAAYATSTTTVYTTETSVETLQFPTGSFTIDRWTATVVLTNPDHWPVEALVGVAFMRNMPTTVNTNGWSGSLNVGMEGFPSWGHQPGLQATDQNGQVRPVGPADIQMPKYVACSNKTGDSSFTAWTGGRRTNLLAVSFSELGPKYVAIRYSEVKNTPTIGTAPVCIAEAFYPLSTTPRLRGHATAVFPTATTTITSTSLSTSTYYRYSLITTIRTEPHRIFRSRMITYIDFILSTITMSDTYTTTLTTTLTYSGTYTATGDVEDNQWFTFPGMIYSVTDAYWNGYNSGWYRYMVAYRLAYTKVVDLWNTTNILAYVEGPQTVYVKADRPLGIAAVYVFDSVSSTVPPPPPPPSHGPCMRVYANPYCISNDAEGKVDVTVPPYYTAPCESEPNNLITASTDNPNCQGFLVTGSGAIPKDQATGCPKDENGNITCEMTSSDQYVVFDCNH